MHNDNAVLRKLNTVGSNACRGALIAAMTVSMMPTSAFAAAATTETGSEATNNAPISATSEETKSLSSEYSLSAVSDDAASSSTSYDLTKIADGTYEGTATADSKDPLNKAGDEWNAADGKYDVNVSVTVKSGKIAKVEVADYSSLGDDDWDRMHKAVNGFSKKGTSYKGMVEQIETAGNTTSIDAVSTATISSNAIKAAVDNALQTAYDEQNPSTPATDEYTYGYAGLTWAEYWAGENVQAAGSSASSSELDSRNEADKGAFDVVTRATANHGLHRGSYQCMATIYTNEGATFDLATWAADGKSFTTTDGKTVTWNRGAMTCDGASYTLKDYEVTGLKYVPVKIKTSDLEAFKASHSFVANGETLAGGYTENNLQAYSGLVADVDANTNGIKTVTNNNGTFSFSAAATTGTDSGIKGQELKTATDIKPTVKDASGSYGEFLRVDLNGNYGDLGANMQSVTWTYYGDDATYTNALASYGTKFAADNWMHKSMGIQLGLTKSERCQLPEGTNGTGYWKLTVHALGYNDYTYTFQATDDNIVGAKEPVTDATKAQLQELYDKATSLDKSKYTKDSWTASSIETETAETKDLLAKKNLGEAEAAEQITHLQGALDALVSLYPQAGDYVLMNIPYADFYAAESNNAGTDIVTSATLQKTRSSLASGSYHVNSDGTDISGATFAVKVGEGDIDWSKFTRVTDNSSVTITTSIKGKESTTTYTGKDALFESANYSYYVLPAGEVPTNYKELTADSEGNLNFGAVEGKKATELANVTANFKTSSKYGDYEIDFKNLREQMVDADGNQATVYGAVVNAADADGTTEGYGMRTVENIWKGKEIAWSCGLVNESHGSPLSSRHYKSMMGKTIKSVTFYTSTGTYTVAMNQYVPVKASKSEIDVEANAKADAETAEVKATLPADFKVEYKLDDADVTVDNGTFSIKDLKPGKHTLVARDASGKYADVTSEFTVTTDKTVAKFDEGTSKITAANEGDDVENFIGNITTVNVNGTDYAASGRGSVKIINADGSINLDAVAGGQQSAKPKATGQQQGTKVFANYGTYTIKVTSTGYNTPLEFTFTHKADRTDLDKAIDAAEKLDKSAFTAVSWNAMSDALSAAKTVQANDAATDDAIAQALNALNSAVANLAAKATDEAKSALADLIESAGTVKNDGYTDASWNDFQTALDEAKQVAASEDPSASEVASAVDKLKATQDALTKKGAEGKPAGGSTSTTTTTTTTDTKKANASKKDASGLPGTGDTQIATVGIFAGIGAAIAAAGVAIRRRMQH